MSGLARHIAGHAAEEFVARAYAARHQGLNGVISYIAHANDRSRALAGRLGATYERDGELLGKKAQIWRHPQIDLTTERTGQ